MGEEMAVNYTLKALTGSKYLKIGINDPFEFVQAYLEKRNIHVIRCSLSGEIDCEDHVLVFDSIPAEDVLGLSINMDWRCFLSEITEVVTLIAAPIPIKSSTSDIIRVDAGVLASLGVGISVCALFVAMTSRKRSPLRAFVAWMENIWVNFSLLFSEAAGKEPTGWRARMVFLTWLWASLLITIEVGSYLKSSFTVTTYEFVDSFQDTLKYDGVKYWKFYMDYVEWARKCTTEERDKYKQPCKNADSPWGFFENILTIRENSRNDAGTRDVAMSSLKMLKQNLQNNFGEMQRSGRLFYQGQTVVSSYFFMASLDTLNSHFLRETIVISCLVEMETQAMAYLEFEGGWILDMFSWKKPTEEEAVLYLEDCTLLFNFWLYGMLLSVVVLLLEASTYFVSRCSKGKNSKATNKQWF